MGTDGLTFGQQDIRGTDSNSLLRMYDLAREHLVTSHSQAARERRSPRRPGP